MDASGIGHDIVRLVTERLAPYGIDIVHPFDLRRYNDLARALPRLDPLPHFGRETALALLVGNTRKLWPPFVKAYRDDARLTQTPHPLDAYAEAAIKESVQELPCPAHLRFGHHRQERFISMLHLAEASGMARVSPAKLGIHPEFGFWFGLRAVIVLDAAPPPEPAAAPPDPCRGCDAPCRAALAKALAEIPRNEHDAHWRLWIAVRDSCPVGRENRYGDNQVQYHHSKNPAFIREDDTA